MKFPFDVILMLVLVAEVSSSKCSWSCKCYPLTKTALCGKHKPGIKKLPTVPLYVRHYTFSNGNIPVVNRTVLSPLSNNTLLSLALVNDRISRLENDTFLDFHSLVLLDLTSNKIALSLLKSAFLSLGYDLKTIILSDMNIDFIPTDLLETNKTLNVSKLIFSHNRLTSFNDSLLGLMPRLLSLDLSNNQISSYYYNYQETAPELEKLQMSNNRLGTIPSFCWLNGTIRYYRLRSLDVGSNGISSLATIPSSCLDRIKRLVLSGNPITVLQNNTFSGLYQLFVLYLSELSHLRVIDELAFNSTSLSILHLDRDVRIKPDMFPRNLPFSWAPNLSKVSFQETRILLPPYLFKKLLLQLKSVTRLNLQRTRITAIPPRTLSQLHSLRELDLQGNYLARWDDDTFSNVTQLNYLNLDGNKISVINETSFPVEFRKHIKTLNLGNNNFLCTCALLWFRTWMKKVMANKTIKFINYPRKYHCTSPKRLRLDKFNPTEKSCKPLSPFLIPFVSTGSLIVVAVAVSVAVYRNRWNIRYFVYTMRKHNYRPLLDQEVKYDAIVLFESSDYDWMTKEVGDFLETELNLRLCIHERDFEVGKLIFDNIVDCMDQSEKIIFILSNKFARSKWCQCELKLALNKFFKYDQQVVVVVLETVERKNMFKSLKTLLENCTYISWNEHERQLFRTRLKKVMNRENDNI